MASSRMSHLAVLCAAQLMSVATHAAELEFGSVASGTGRIASAPSSADSQAYEDFRPTVATALRNAKSDHVWLLISDADSPGRGWATAADPVEVLRQWCEYEHAKWVLYDLDAKGEPQLAHECAGTGSVSTAMISTINGLASVAPTWEVFDGKVVRGRVRSGSGACGDDYCEPRGDYVVDAPVH